MSVKKFSSAPLILVIKRELKARSLTYRDVANALGSSENSVKLRFSKQRLPFEHVLIIADLLGLTMVELMKKIEDPPIQQLSIDQEVSIVSDIRLLLIAICVMDHWTIDDIIENYTISKAECIGYLLKLERIGIIELLPQNRIRKRIVRNVDWVPGGPFHHFVANRMSDFLDSHFDQKFESRLITRAILTPAAIKQLQIEMLRLKQYISYLHEECLDAPLNQRHGIVLFMAERDWEMKEFKALRRTQPAEKPSSKS